MDTLENISVLFLPSWYPHRKDPMLGLFVQRHAEALAMKLRVGVLYLHPEEDLAEKFDIQFSDDNGVNVCRVYYRNIAGALPVISQLRKGLRYLKASRIGLKELKKHNFEADICHVHVLTRAGIPALQMKWRLGIPYFITEHWSRYLQTTNTYKGFLRKKLTKLIVKNAESVSTVTQNLAQAMQAHGLVNEEYLTIPNVVDTDLFQPQSGKEQIDIKHFIHISVFEDKSKNISGMLRAIAELRKQRNDFRLSLIGEGMDLDAMKSLASDLQLDDTVSFEGLKEGKELAGMLASADLLLLFSNYENIPVVINEAMACAIPTLATRVGGIPEYLEPFAGRMVEAVDEIAFRNAMNDYLDGKWDINPELMRQKALTEFSREAIALRFLKMYSL